MGGVSEPADGRSAATEGAGAVKLCAGDRDAAARPANFMHRETGYYQSIRFRYSVADVVRGDIEECCRTLVLGLIAQYPASWSR